MRINLKRLTDAVPELMELEFVTEDSHILVSATITIAQAEDLHRCLGKALIAHYNANNVVPISGISTTHGYLPTAKEANNKWGLPYDCYVGVVAFLRDNQKINAIKLIRENTSLSLYESKRIADEIAAGLPS